MYTTKLRGVAFHYAVTFLVESHICIKQTKALLSEQQLAESDSEHFYSITFRG
jgi:hypothetical protein